MTKLEQLIQEKCPNGVEYRPLWQLLIFDKRFKGVDKSKQQKVVPFKHVSAEELKNMPTNNGDVKLLATGKFEGYTTDEIANESMNVGEVITIPSGGTANIKYHNGKFVDSGNILAISSDIDKYDLKYIYHCLLKENDLIQSYYRGGSVQHPEMGKIAELSFPVPPLEVQREIVEILDKFTLLTAELTAELTARKEQFEFYRNSMIKECENYVSLKSICKKISSGGTPLKSNKEYYDNGTVPWLRTQEVVFSEIKSTDCFITDKAVLETSAKWIPANCVIVAISGATAGRCAINKIPLTTNQHCLNLHIDDSKALYKYVYYCVCSFQKELLGRKEGARGDLTSTLISSLNIPLPSLDKQQRIVDILDRFDALCNDISSGLPAEIEARQKQYEYYRDKLLSFKRLEN